MDFGPLVFSIMGPAKVKRPKSKLVLISDVYCILYVVRSKDCLKFELWVRFWFLKLLDYDNWCEAILKNQLIFLFVTFRFNWTQPTNKSIMWYNACFRILTHLFLRGSCLTVILKRWVTFLHVKYMFNFKLLDNIFIFI